MTPSAVDFAAIVGPLLVLGTLLKNAFPKFPNRLIPLATWAVGIVGYCLKSGSWSGAAIFDGILLSATATGIHSGLKNTLGIGADAPVAPPQTTSPPPNT